MFMLRYPPQRYGNGVPILKEPTFKSGRSTIGSWGAIALGVKGPVQFLRERRGGMNSDIYIDQVLEELGLPSYK